MRIRRAPRDGDTRGRLVPLLAAMREHHEVSPVLTGGDVDADWAGAFASGEEAVGGTVATPGQDVVDELGRALGVEQGADAEVVTSVDILRARDRFRWHLERDAADAEEGRPHRRRGSV
ncbi:MAG: hypothetical protein HYR86_12870 [Candidatus Rokubacteria bacterium]|nr:hypothetical protein [Candidatus Rokubacteria bacterium]